jgi:glucose/arabinose dehydrogenase
VDLVRRGAFPLLPFLLFTIPGCGNNSSPGVPDASNEAAVTYSGAESGTDSGIVILPAGDASIADPCSLPGSILFTSSGRAVIAGGMANEPDLSFLKLPAGFCAHYYGTVGNTRQLRFAPGGELFVASPTTVTTGGGASGHGAIVVLPDDDRDGYADTTLTFLNQLPSTQGLMFVPGYIYFQNGTQIMVMPYQSGQRAATGTGSVAVDITVYTDTLHWPKVLDVADDGTIYVTNGGDQAEPCDTSRPFHGGILKIDGSDGGAEVARGMRNPIALRCQRGHDMCYALELALDRSGGAMHGREKLIPVRQGDDWGFSCCATTNTPYTGVVNVDGGPPGDCSETATEIEGFTIGDTPFGLDFETGRWPAPYTNAAFVSLHGHSVSWAGARIVAVTVDADSGAPVPGNDWVTGTDTGGMGDFATGWDDKTLSHGRPAPVTFSPDGRLFVGDDRNGVIFWIAPIAR